MIFANSENSLAYNLLIHPSYRWLRHLVVILIVFIISFDEVNTIFRPDENQGGLMWFAFLYISICYLCGGYLNLYCLIPRFFLKRRFGSYFFWYFLLIVTLVGFSFLIEYVYVYYLEVTPEEGSSFMSRNVSLAFLCACITTAISLAGVSVTIILKHWLLENKQLTQLQQRKIEMEVEQVKEQISPTFLFWILHHTGEKAETEPQKASAMILHLSRLLRYQLYDGNRAQVLLASEIQFLTTYLVLEQYENDGFDFQIITEGEVSHTLIAPLLFLPLVQEAMKKWRESKDKLPIEIIFRIIDDVLSIQCNYLDWDMYTVDERVLLIKRAILIYPDRCSFEKNRLNLNL